MVYMYHSFLIHSSADGHLGCFQGNQIWKRHMHPNVHRSTVYHSQDMEAIYLSLFILFYPIKRRVFCLLLKSLQISWIWAFPILKCFILIKVSPILSSGFPGSSGRKESTFNSRDPGLIPGLGRSAGEGIGFPLQYSLRREQLFWPGESMDRGAWWAVVHGVTKSWIQLSN